jgi:DNA repair protein RecN (Recombination protein N)
MLVELRIENFAIIHRLELEFETGLITFTGETGAGKSIILDAIEAVLGGKVDAGSLRSGADRASIEATFRLDDGAARASNAAGTGMAAVVEILKREDLLDDPDQWDTPPAAPKAAPHAGRTAPKSTPLYVTLQRDIRREGRTTARVNGRSVSLPLLREVGAFLVDIHGQSEHLSLLNVRHHLGLLDRYASLEELLHSYSEAYRRLQAVRRELDEVRQAEQDAARRTDLLTYQVNEIESASLRTGEEETLRQDRTRLANAENLASLAQATLALLEEGTPESPAVSDLIGQAVHHLSALSRIDASRTRLYEQAELVLDQLAELSRELSGYMEQVEYNPHRLEQIEERLDLIQNLKRKYGGSPEAVLDYAAQARRQLDTMAHAGERIAELEAEETTLLEQLGQLAQALSQQRRQAAGRLSKSMEAELNDLNMAGARFSVDFQTRHDASGLPAPDGRRLAFDSTGVDRVEFLIAPNPGEGLKPLVKTASGGETSRLMLALKNVLAQADYVPTLIFDEIDQGIGGRVGMIVGQKLWNLGRQHQVLCVTHLPQLAAFGDQHFRVTKQVQAGRTVTHAERLQDPDRRQELAQMMGAVSEGTLRSAEEMLQAVRQSPDRLERKAP